MNNYVSGAEVSVKIAGPGSYNSRDLAHLLDSNHTTQLTHF